MQNGGVLPPSLLQENRVPRFYKEAIAKCGAPNQSQLPNTALVYNLMVTSCLPRAVLGNIWSLVNRTMPGQLTRQEFFSCLALIALIQVTFCSLWFIIFFFGIPNPRVFGKV